MIRVLVVDDEQEWRTLIKNALPDYRVDAAGSYPEARDLLQEGTPYDAAIVDLNLVRHDVLDYLGKKFLGHLQEKHPATPRIVVTGAPPGAVGGLVKNYGLAELFLKQAMRLGDVGDVVEKELKASGLSLDLRAERGDRWDDFSGWRDSVRHRLERKTKHLEAERRNADRDSGPAREAADALGALKASKAVFESDCSAVAARLANIRDRADLDAAIGEFTALHDKYEDAI
jgi:CheY-like chemotaxis protein